MKPFDITLCLIVKDEEEYLSTCIESVLPFVKNILIADTGSTDQTISLSRKYTEHVEKISFVDGFSHARNYLLERVRTDWVLFLDADEYFESTELNKLADYFVEKAAHVDAFNILRYNFFSTGAFYTSETIKLFRSKPDIRYSGVIVDSIKPSLKERGVIVDVPVILNHFGHCRSLDIRNKKAEVYLKMMDQELSINPSNFRVIGYKALVLRTLGKLSEALLYSDKALEVAPEQGHPHFVKGHIERVYGNHECSILFYSKALELDGINAVYLNCRGIAYLSQGNLEKAEIDFKNGIERFPHHIHFKINLGLVEQAKGNYKEAFDLFKTVGEQHPAFLKDRFSGISEVDPYSGCIYDTAFNFHGLGYHLAYCQAKMQGLL